MFEEEKCSICSMEQSSALNMKSEGFLLSECGHFYCSDCIDKKAKKNFNCVRCSSLVKIYNLTVKSKDEYEIERDIAVRKKVRAIFNKVESDFTELNYLKAYEETVEDIIYNLVHGIDVSETQAKIDEYKRLNAESITRNQALLLEEDLRLRAKLQEEKSRQDLQLQLHQVM